ncbi:N-6 DNA methylase [Arthrobacter sp. D2-10]
MFEAAFDYVDDVLRKDAGCGNELDYVEQTSWILFLKYLDDLEEERALEASLTSAEYKPILEPSMRWQSWAVPKTASGSIDHQQAMTGDDLVEFVNEQLFPQLAGFLSSARSADTIEYKIGTIFTELRNKVQSGYNLREILDRVDELHFSSNAEKDEMSHLYEGKIQRMGNAGRNGGEYYTPRPLIRAIVEVVNPQLGQTVYDGAVGSAGFLIEAYEHMKSPELTTDEVQQLEKNTFFGKEKKSLAFIIGVMNMILHGIETPNIVRTNTLSESLNDLQDADRYDVILANPPFGGRERAEVQHNFDIKTSETAYLFLQHFIKRLRAGGKAGVVIKNTFLSTQDGASVALRKLLLSSCNLHTVLLMPAGAFPGTGVKTVVLFFEKGASTKRIWFYECDPGRNLGKTYPLTYGDMEEFVSLQRTFSVGPKSWSVDAADLNPSSFNLSVTNPHLPLVAPTMSPQGIIDEMFRLDAENAETLSLIRALL